jgi:hypothetical protein
MGTRTLLTATIFGTALAFGGLAVTAPAALASTVEGKISSIAATQHSVKINKKSYRVDDGAKLLISGKPASFADLKTGMNCKATLNHGVEASMLICTK